MVSPLSETKEIKPTITPMTLANLSQSPHLKKKKKSKKIAKKKIIINYNYKMGFVKQI